MGKSLTATLVGLLINEGHFGLEDPAPVPEWQGEGDPRAAIRIADLMRMSSGLHFIVPRDPDYTPDKGYHRDTEKIIQDKSRVPAMHQAMYHSHRG